MSLILSFRPGDRVLVAYDVFQVDVPGRRLVSSAGDVITLSDKDTTIASGVDIRVNHGLDLSGLVLAFTAPAGTLIQRIRAEDAQ